MRLPELQQKGGGGGSARPASFPPPPPRAPVVDELRVCAGLGLLGARLEGRRRQVRPLPLARVEHRHVVREGALRARRGGWGVARGLLLLLRGGAHLVQAAVRVAGGSRAAECEELPVRDGGDAHGGVVPAHVGRRGLLEARPRQRLCVEGPAVCKGLRAVPAALDDHGRAAGLRQREEGRRGGGRPGGARPSAHLRNVARARLGHARRRRHSLDLRPRHRRHVQAVHVVEVAALVAHAAVAPEDPDVVADEDCRVRAARRGRVWVGVRQDARRLVHGDAQVVEHLALGDGGLCCGRGAGGGVAPPASARHASLLPLRRRREQRQGAAPRGYARASRRRPRLPRPRQTAQAAPRIWRAGQRSTGRSGASSTSGSPQK